MKYLYLLAFSSALIFYLTSCISPKTYLMSESLRVHFEEENTSLKQDTTLKGMRYRNAAKLNTDLIARMSAMTVDTARLNRQVRFLSSQITSSSGNSKMLEAPLSPSQQALKEKEAALSLKEAQLDAKEKELHFKELELKSLKMPQAMLANNTNLDALYKKVKESIGTYGVDNVTVDMNGNYFQINIPDDLLFISDEKDVQGKGLPILIKLAELLKNQPVFVKIVNETKNNANTKPNTWNVATQQVSESANIIGRYGFPSQNIVVAVQEISQDNNKNKPFTHIQVSNQAFN